MRPPRPETARCDVDDRGDGQPGWLVVEADAVSAPHRILLVAASLLALLTAAVGYALAAGRTTTHFATGYAYASPFDITATSQGWSDDVPLDMSWRDASGTWHDQSRPACLAASRARLPIKFAWVSAHVDGNSWRTVVWVDCS